MSASKDAKEIKDSLAAQDSKLTKLEAMIAKAMGFITGKTKSEKEEDPEKDKPEEEDKKDESEEGDEDPEKDKDKPEEEDKKDEASDFGARLDTLSKSVETLTKNFDSAVEKAVEAKTKGLDAASSQKVKKDAAKTVSNVTGKPLAAANDNPLAGKPAATVDAPKGLARAAAALAKRRGQ